MMPKVPKAGSMHGVTVLDLATNLPDLNLFDNLLSRGK